MSEDRFISIAIIDSRLAEITATTARLEIERDTLEQLRKMATVKPTASSPPTVEKATPARHNGRKTPLTQLVLRLLETDGPLSSSEVADRLVDTIPADRNKKGPRKALLNVLHHLREDQRVSRDESGRNYVAEALERIEP